MTCQSITTYSPITWLENYRHQLIVNMYQTHPTKLSALIIAMVWGETSYLSNTVKEDYQILGLVHLLAISGSHVIILLTLINKLLNKFITILWIEAMIKYSLLLAYMILAGQHMPIIRAVLMVILLDLAKKLQLTKFDCINSLVMLFLIINYRILFDVGFQLSFTITYALILFNDKLKSLHNNFMKSFLTILLCQIVLLPLTISYFYTISLASIIANLLYIPFFTIILFPIILFLALCYMISDNLFSLSHDTCQLVINLNDIFITWLRSTLVDQLIVGAWSSLALIILTIMILYFLYLLTVKYYYRAIMIVLMIIIWSVLNSMKWSTTVSFVDVGQGDSIIIETAFNHQTMMIDTGGQFKQSLYDKIFNAYFKGQGIKQIDILVLTHADFDHMGDTLNILQHVNVKQLVMTQNSYQHEKMVDIINYAEAHQIDIRLVATGEKIVLDNLQFVVISPDKDYPIQDTNANSIVLYGEIGGRTFLFTGDATSEEEQHYMTYLPHINVLKAGHHGSHTSSGLPLLQKIQPDDVIISAGVNNRYHHPHRVTLNRLAYFTDHIYSTQNSGMIRYHYI